MWVNCHAWGALAHSLGTTAIVNEEPWKDVKQENDMIPMYSLKRSPWQLAGERMEMPKLETKG